MKIFSSVIKILIVLLYVIISDNALYLHGKNNRSTITFYNNVFTYIELNLQDMKISFYDMDQNYFPLIPDKFRGCFKLEQLNDRSYMLLSDPPGKICIDNVKINWEKSDSKDIKICINLNRAKSDYILMIKSISTNVMYKYQYNKNFNIVLSKDPNGYQISILPSNYSTVSVDGLIYGFHHTIKYLNIPIDYQQFPESGGTIIIDLPLFNDDIFNEWDLNGDVIILENNKLTFHGQQFNIYESF